MKEVGAVIATIILVVLVCVGGWFLYWKIAKAENDNNSEIYNNSYQRQTALVDEINRNISDVKSIDVQISYASGDPELSKRLSAQRAAVVTSVCNNIGKLSGTVTESNEIRLFASKEC